MAIAPISLAGFFTGTSGQNAIGGLSSGLNTQAVIAALTASQSAQITQLNDQVSVSNKQIGAISTLQQLLSALRSAADPLSNPQSVDTSNNLWAVRTSQVSSNTTQPASNFLSATVASGTAPGTYAITDISQTATYSTQQTSTTFTSATAAAVTSGKFNAGTFNVVGPKGTGTITFTANDSLNQVANDINAASDQSGISASVVQTLPGTYILAFTSTATGESTGFDLSTTGTVPAGDNLSNVFQNISFTGANTGQDAKFKLNNVDIQRSTNTISDLINGVTLNLLQDTTAVPTASFTIQVAPDTTSIAQGIDAFAAAYNNFLSFYAQQTQLNSSGTPASAAILYSDSTLQGIFNSVTAQANSIVNGLAGSAPNSLASLGITFTDSPATSTTPSTPNTLSVDNNTLVSLLQSNFSDVENVFGAHLTTTSPNLVLFQGPTTQSITNFTVNINQSGSTYSATYTSTTGAMETVALTATPLSTGGIALSGPAGSVFAGLQLIYGTSDDTSLNVTLSQGIAATLDNSVKGVLTLNTGQIANDQTAIQTHISTLQTQITTVTSQMLTTRTNLLQRFSQLEAAISQSNNALNLLNAQATVQSAGG